MPNCFQLTRKGTTEPAILQGVDAELCRVFGVDVHPKYWYADWYHVIGFLIALKGVHLGSAQLREEVIKWYSTDRLSERDTMIAVLDYLETHYTSDAWVEIGKRND